MLLWVIWTYEQHYLNKITMSLTPFGLMQEEGRRQTLLQAP